MSKIKVLPDNLANQIAAGEVVERPASVVKELVENSLDAGAKRIQVDVELGGRRLMRISDDGEGMIRDDAVLAFERHATSKISALADLGSISTLGFRGEALASIASVAKVELLTKTADSAAATRVAIEGGKLLDVGDGARADGTTISVKDLFFNTPARRKFMRSEATENFHLASIVTHYALAHPEVSFTLTSNGREVMRVAPARDLRERAYQLFGSSLIESLLPVAGGHENVCRVGGYVSAPRERRTSRDSQYFFVNGRYVKDKVIAGGLLEGYRAVLPHGVYPVAFLFIEIPLEEVDVNVHPAKTEIRFRRSEAVKEAIASAVRSALSEGGIRTARDFAPAEKSAEGPVSTEPLQPEMGFGYPVATASPSQVPTPAAPLDAGSVEPSGYDGSSFLGGVADAVTFPEVVDQTPAVAGEPPRYAELPPVDSATKVVRLADVGDVAASKIKPIAQLHDSFIIAVDDQGMLLIDQHVAHERILFDKFRRREESRAMESQQLLIPETFDLTPAQLLAFDHIEMDLEEIGFGILRMSGRTIAIKSVPADLPQKEVRNLFAEILSTIDAEKKGSAHASVRDDIAASLACKAAVKINMKLTHEKMQWLVDNLLVTTSPSTCPHGRPVILRLTMKDIERGFHRT